MKSKGESKSKGKNKSNGKGKSKGIVPRLAGRDAPGSLGMTG
ncbi:MAG TPA: hypothetical protein VM009_04820 [Terriglobales bacterium]|nr:hypothetical protein [Terriglobales bacterium]